MDSLRGEWAGGACGRRIVYVRQGPEALRAAPWPVAGREEPRRRRSLYERDRTDSAHFGVFLHDIFTTHATNARTFRRRHK